MEQTIAKIIKLLSLLVILAVLVLFVFPFCVYKYFNYYSGPYMFSKTKQVPQSHTALVLGAQVLNNNRVSHVLYDRIISSVQLYRSKKIKKFLLSGDHGTKQYDEVNTMKHHLLKNRIEAKHIFLDHAGFDTYDSIIRADKVFGAKDIVIVTQRFHLPRAIYIARKSGLNAYGYVADKRTYSGITRYKIREMYARVKALLEVQLGSSPKFLGKKISIFGDGRKSWD